MEAPGLSQPCPAGSSAQAAWKAGITGGILILLSCFPFPEQPGLLLCGFQWLTQKPCPFCGLTRSLSFLARGYYKLAVGFHPLGPVVFGILLALFLSSLIQLTFPAVRLVRLPKVASRIFWASCGVLFAVCGVLRLLLQVDQ
jgi:hypothetical protein